MARHSKTGYIDKQAMHPDEGVPMMYFDQLNTIAHHLRQMKYVEDEVEDEIPQLTPPSDTSKLCDDENDQSNVHRRYNPIHCGYKSSTRTETKEQATE